ncbi:MAG: hypothetical protein ACRD1T_01155, partial [Acidimicrobiia bacterium]
MGRSRHKIFARNRLQYKFVSDAQLRRPSSQSIAAIGYCSPPGDREPLASELLTVAGSPRRAARTRGPRAAVARSASAAGLLFGAATAFQHTAAFFAKRVKQSLDTADKGRARFGKH